MESSGSGGSAASRTTSRRRSTICARPARRPRGDVRSSIDSAVARLRDVVRRGDRKRAGSGLELAQHARGRDRGRPQGARQARGAGAELARFARRVARSSTSAARAWGGKSGGDKAAARAAEEELALELAVEGAQQALARLVGLLVVAHLAQLVARQVGQPAVDLADRELVVGADREARDARALRRTRSALASGRSTAPTARFAGVLGAGPDLLAGPLGGVAELAPRAARGALRRAPLRRARSATSSRSWATSRSSSPRMSSACSRPRVTSRLTSSSASPRVMRPRRTASSTTSWSRSREIVTLFSSASRKACTLCSARSPPRAASRSLAGRCRLGGHRRRASLGHLRGQTSVQLDRGVVGEAQRQPVLRAELTLLGRPGAGRPGAISTPRTSRWSIESGAVAPRRPKRSLELRRRRRCWPGRTLKSPPRTSGPLAGPLGRLLGGQQQLRLGAGRRGAGVQAGDAEAALEPGEGHRPALGAPLPAARAAWRSRCPRSAACARIRLEPPSEEPIRSGPAPRDPPAQAHEPVARGLRRGGLGAALAREARLPARRALLQQRDVPVGAAEHVGVLAPEVAVHLHVRLVRSGAPRSTPRGRCRGPVGRPVAAVEDVPGEDA